jgi:hypothetical protein
LEYYSVVPSSVSRSGKINPFAKIPDTAAYTTTNIHHLEEVPEDIKIDTTALFQY